MRGAALRCAARLTLQLGAIAVQAEGHPTEFRKIEVLNLAGCVDHKAANFKPYYVKADNTKCVYSTPHGKRNSSSPSPARLEVGTAHRLDVK